MNTTSITLLERVKQRSDQPAWNQFARLYTPLLFFWARRMGLSLEESEDLVQELMLIVMDKVQNFEHRGKGSFRAWMRTVAISKCRDRFRRRQPPVGLGDDELLDSLVAQEEKDPFWEVEYRQRLVAQAVSIMQTEFEQNTWKVCWQHVVEGRPAADIARDFGLGEATVYVYSGRVLRRLREQLQGLWE